MGAGPAAEVDGGPGDRAVLGAADVCEADLSAMVADQLGLPVADVELLTCRAEVVPYDLDAITTAGRYRVHGDAATPRGVLPFRFFVKHVQAWSRSPLFGHVPPEYRAAAAAGVPWYTEPLVYRSDLARRLPAGLTMPRAYAVRDLDAESAVVWLEDVDAVPVEWSSRRLAHVAHLLGRLAVDPDVAALATIGETARSWPVRSYVEGRLALQVLPMLGSDDVWRHPLVAQAFSPDLRARLLRAADDVPRFLEEVERVPIGTSHGDACPNNLLVRPEGGDLVLIDYGFWGTKPIGFDLGQLVVGDVQVGRRGAGTLAGLEDLVTDAYVDGLRAQGYDAVDRDGVQRAHAVCMLVYSGLSTLPFEHLGQEPTPALHVVAAERAATARFVLDLVDATVPYR